DKNRQERTFQVRHSKATAFGGGNLLLQYPPFRGSELRYPCRASRSPIRSLLDRSRGLVKKTSGNAVHKLSPVMKRAIFHGLIEREDTVIPSAPARGCFSRSFNQKTGLSPIRFLARSRIPQTKVLPTSSDQPVTEIAMKVGFSDADCFNRAFHKESGLSLLPSGANAELLCFPRANAGNKIPCGRESPPLILGKEKRRPSPLSDPCLSEGIPSMPFVATVAASRTSY
ncbi:MAG: helix-turn-helix domain-containing protein, partial [Anaerolineales bacterium]